MDTYVARQVFSELARLTKEVEELRKDKERLDRALEQAKRVNKMAMGNFYLCETRESLDELAAMQQKGEE